MIKKPNNFVRGLVSNIRMPNQLMRSMCSNTNLILIYLVINQTGKVRVTFYDVSGRVCRTLCSRTQEPGHYSTRVQHLPAGIYFCKLKTPVNERVKKLVFID